MNRILGYTFAILILLSCEKVIEVEVDESDKQLVVEGVLNDRVGESYILLSKTGSIYESGGFEKVSGAAVEVTDMDANVFVFTENATEPGRYELSTFSVLPNNEYHLNIDVGGLQYTATCKTFSKPNLDSLSYIEQVGGFGGVSEDTSYLVFYNFKDNADEENYYRLKVFLNGEKSDIVYLISDELFNGQDYSAPFFANDVRKGDTLRAELLTLDKANYRYQTVRLSNQDSGPFSAAPANPPTNIEGENVIGYFGAYTTDTMTIILPQ